MKNLHILPTDKPSSLIIYNSKLKLVNYPVITPSGNQKHVYITSDEEIKEGDWVYNNKENIVEQITSKTQLIFVLEENKENQTFKKIILTTDQDLIKDGVQAIDDEFLEWFVKNPSCETIDVRDIKTIPALQLTGNNHLYYKMIIPKEKPKQETLEEAAEKLYQYKSENPPYTIITPKAKIEGFIEGAKWQQEQEQNNENSWFNEYQEVENYIIKRIGNKFLEATPDKYKTASEATIALLENNWKKERMYSEDDMIMFADFFHNYKELLKKEKWEILELSKKDILKKWFEQFKKK